MITHELEIVVDGVTTTKLMTVDPSLEPGFQVVGCVDLKYKGRRIATIRQLYTRPAYRRQGIATALVNRCLALASQANCEALSLCLAGNNTEGRDFYRKLGFTLAWQDDDGELIMTKYLRAAPAELKLWPKRPMLMRQSIHGVLKRLHPMLNQAGDPQGYIGVLQDFETHLDQLGQRFYAGDLEVVDEFLQLYDLDDHRLHARKID